MFLCDPICLGISGYTWGRSVSVAGFGKICACEMAGGRLDHKIATFADLNGGNDVGVQAKPLRKA